MAPKVVGAPDHPRAPPGASPLGSCVDGSDRGDGRRDRTDRRRLGGADSTRCVGRRADAHRAVVGPAHARRLRRARRVHQRGQRRVGRSGWTTTRPGSSRSARASATWRWRRSTASASSRYIVIGTLRIAAAFVVCHLVGRAYRDRCAACASPATSASRPKRSTPINRGFDKAEVLIIPFFVGSNIVAALTRRASHPPGQAGGAAGDRHRRSPGADLVAGEGVRGPAARRPRLAAALPAGGRSSSRSRSCVLVNVRNFRRGRG